MTWQAGQCEAYKDAPAATVFCQKPDGHDGPHSFDQCRGHSQDGTQCLFDQDHDGPCDFRCQPGDPESGPLGVDHGGVAEELVEAADMGSADGMGGCPVDECELPAGHTTPHCRRALAFDSLTEDDAVRLLGLAGEYDHMPAEVRRHWDEDKRDSRYLSKLAARIRAQIG